MAAPRRRSFASRPIGRSLRTPVAHATGGFSLVELIVVIVITGIIASVVGIFIAGPIQGFLDQARRAELVDAAQLALVRMGRDLRAALPNSLRINGNALELLLTLDGDRYRTEPPGTNDDRLDFTAADGKFNTLAPLFPPNPLVAPVTPYTVNGFLAIYPLQQTGADPYRAADGVMSPAGGIQITPVQNPGGSGRMEYQVSLTEPGGPGAHRFAFDSPTHRVFLVLGPVSYICAGGDLVRYDSYSVTDTQPDPPAGPLLVTTVIVDDIVQSCAFTYAPGTAQRNAVVSVSLVLADPAAPTERVRLLRQVHMDNTP